MTYQQWLQLYQQLQAMGYTPQQVIQMIGQPTMLPPQMGGPFGGGGGMTTAQQIGMGVMGPLALGLEAGPYNLQMQAARTGMDPGALARGINAATPQLTKGAISALTRATAPGIAGSGLASAPGMSQQILAEAFAPSIINEQQIGANAYMRGLGMPFQVGQGLAGQLPGDLIDYALLMGMGP